LGTVRAVARAEPPSIVSTTAGIDNINRLERLGDGLRERLARWLASVAGRPAGGLASFTVPVESDRDAGCAVPAQGYAWSRPSRHHDLAGAGVAAQATARGDRRFETLGDAHARLLADWTCEGSESAPDPRIAFAGFCFDPDEVPGPEWHGLANAQLTVPAVLLHRRHGRGWLTFTCPTGGGPDTRHTPESLLGEAGELLAHRSHQIPARGTTPVRLEDRRDAPDGERWRVRLGEALGDIERGRFEKLVLTRRVRYASSRPVDCGRVFRALEAEHPECAGYAVTLPGFALLGVSPERLVSIEDNTVTVDALAGTAPRHPDPAADTALARRMLDDAKTREEHRLVRDRIVEALAPCCTDVVAPSAPGLMRLPRVQHLWSPIRGHLRPGENLLTLAGRLHPTPAVGGSPVDRAVEWLAEREGGRGWYTGACGWLGPAGDGELVVVLRCGVINDRTVDLFAGAGIVAGSEPEQELAETDWKLMTMRGALQFG
jgi:isochorismate synthase